MRSFRLFACLAALISLSGCTGFLFDNPVVSEARVTDQTRAGRILESLPPPEEPIAVVVYDFADQTGQFRNNGSYTDYSSAVTKGGLSILVKALVETGNHQWFRVAERGGLKDLLQERQIIKAMRGQYLGPAKEQLPLLPPMLYGGLLIEGGITSYDSNIVTGGAGAMYLGIGGSAQYRRDIVGVYLRAINVQTGEVLVAVNSSKTIYSASLDLNALKYLTVDNLLQTEVGFTINEPTQFGVRQAIETGLYSLIMEGAIKGIWNFKDPNAGYQAIDAYLNRRDTPPKTVDKKTTPEVVVTPIPATAEGLAEKPAAPAGHAPKK